MIGVTGTDTNVGKTLVCSWLQAHNPDAIYWKPVQTGEMDTGGDTATVRQRVGFSADYYMKPLYHFSSPLAPDQAAIRDGMIIDPKILQLPEVPQNQKLIVEGAGGVYTPIADDFLMADMFSQMSLPMLLVAKTSLGTINHTLLSLEALRAKNLDVKGVVFVGEENQDNMTAIQERGNVPILGLLDDLSAFSRQELLATQPRVPFSQWFNAPNGSLTYDY